jgi:hypothetical protein
MQEYDIALKTVLTRGAAGFLTQLFGAPVARWYNTELPEVRARQADLLGETVDGRLIHIELQSSNDSRMAFRMLEYLVSIEQALKRVPKQLVLYVGEAPMRMKRRIRVEGLLFTYGMRDIRELDSEPLLASESLDDNIIGILARLPDRKSAVRRVLEKIAAGDAARREAALRELAILAGLRSLTSTIREETERMPILTDFRDNDYYGPLFRECEARGRFEGKVEGEAVGTAKGERMILRRQISKRFGSVPEWVNERIEKLDAEQLMEVGDRLLDAKSLIEIFG